MAKIRRSHDLKRDDEPQSTERPIAPSIILADDDADTRRRVARALRADGITVIEASSGFEVLDHLSTALLSGQATEQPDAIIMGLWMPGVSGLSILGGLRDANWGTPIVLLCEYLGRDLCEMYRRLGANAIFEKPFDVDDLRTVVLNLVPGVVRTFKGDGATSFSEERYANTG